MDILQSAILGLIEGFTEFLPISSTGHLIVISDWLGLSQSEGNKAFEVIIQLAAILAVIANYRDRFTRDNLDLWLKLLLAFIPIGVAGLLFHHQIKALFSVKIVAVMFIAGGVVFLIVEFFQKSRPTGIERVEDVTWKQAMWIGISQVFALIPGTSRAGATIVGAMLAGLSRKASAEFSFLLALPVMLAASGFDFAMHYQEFGQGGGLVLGVGFIVVFIVAFLTMKMLLHFLERFTFVAFGVYRILFGILLFAVYL